MVLSGAGGENRTLIVCLEGRHISHYTTPARFVIIAYSHIGLNLLQWLSLNRHTANVAHLVRATGCGSVGSGFDPHHSPQINRSHAGFYLFYCYFWLESVIILSAWALDEISASTCSSVISTVPPASTSPDKTFLATVFSTARWTTRRIGRAPSLGS